MHESCLNKQEKIKKIFNTCNTPEEKYKQVILLGQQLKRMDAAYKIEENLVKGCQSTMFLHAELKDGKILFEADSDALISFGLAAILIAIYSGETAETILKCPPSCLDELGLSASLSPNRANGLYSIHLKMKQEALKFILKKS
ncbi:MAG TPA: SufE family protein [Parachlamydiaceae bacterium]|nr:SufE family protein [Parachlamydiaceae bacterium]